MAKYRTEFLFMFSCKMKTTTLVGSKEPGPRFCPSNKNSLKKGKQGSSPSLEPIVHAIPIGVCNTTNEVLGGVSGRASFWLGKVTTGSLGGDGGEGGQGPNEKVGGGDIGSSSS
jgi:hypothetical protein